MRRSGTTAPVVAALAFLPIWGYEFFGDDPDDQVAHQQATDKVDRLVSHLRSIQRSE